MSIRIIETNSLVYLKWFGFVKKGRLFLIGLILVTFILFAQLITYLKNEQNTFNNMIDGVQNPVVAVVHVPTIEERVEVYIRHKNPKLNDIVASELAVSIVKECKLRKISIELVLGLISAESNFKQYAISSSSALGFMQVLPGWHLDKISKMDNKNIFDANTNVALGVKILSDCMHTHGSVKSSLQCYNGNGGDTTEKYANRVISLMPKTV